jgi:hypothetical protein
VGTRRIRNKRGPFLHRINRRPLVVLGNESIAEPPIGRLDRVDPERPKTFSKRIRHMPS